MWFKKIALAKTNTIINFVEIETHRARDTIIRNRIRQGKNLTNFSNPCRIFI